MCVSYHPPKQPSKFLEDRETVFLLGSLRAPGKCFLRGINEKESEDLNSLPAWLLINFLKLVWLSHVGLFLMLELGSFRKRM